MMLRVVALAAVWVALWGDPSPANILWGVVLAVLLVVFFPDNRTSGARFRPLAVLRYIGSTFVSLVTSTWNVAVAVVKPTPERIEAREIRVPLVTGSPMVATVVANSITLTPGTIAISYDNDLREMSVHVLGRVDTSLFVAEIQKLERTVAATLGVPVPEENRP